MDKSLDVDVEIVVWIPVLRLFGVAMANHYHFFVLCSEKYVKRLSAEIRFKQKKVLKPLQSF